MTSVDDTIAAVAAADSWDSRVTEIRRIPQRHGTNDQPRIYAEIARRLYVSHLAPDFAYVHDDAFYEEPHFDAAYDAAVARTEGFTRVDVDDIVRVLIDEPRTLLVFRTITGLLRNEFAQTTALVAEELGVAISISGNKVDSAERNGRALTPDQARLAAATIDALMRRELFTDPPSGLHSKQEKFDTSDGWASVRRATDDGVPYKRFLHQRHYGGAFRQVLDATSTKRGNLIEDAVEALFTGAAVPYIRTGSHNQGEIAARFQVTVTPAPDFVVFDDNDSLKAMLECKATNDGGTARDKAARFQRLREEGTRLGGVPVIGVLGGTGWARVNDTLGPVVRATDGRVFTLENLDDMLTVTPLPQLSGLDSANRAD